MSRVPDSFGGKESACGWFQAVLSRAVSGWRYVQGCTSRPFTFPGLSVAQHAGAPALVCVSCREVRGHMTVQMSPSPVRGSAHFFCTGLILAVATEAKECLYHRENSGMPPYS